MAGNRLRFEKREGLIPYMECFGPTIQGEGMVVGQKTVFVRTAFCQYACDWCFGIPRNYIDGEFRELDYLIPKIVKRDGTTIKMTDAKVGDEIFTYDDYGRVVLTTIKEIIKNVSDDMYKVKFTNSRSEGFFATGSHPFRVGNEWKDLRDIEEPITMAKDHDYYQLKQYEDIFSYNEIMYIHKLQDGLRGEVYSNNLELIDLYKQGIEKVTSQLSSNGGKNNGMYSDDYNHHNFDYLKRAIREGVIDVKCAVTGSTDNLVVHHIDGNDQNDEIKNFIVINRRVHDNVHSRGKNFKKSDKDVTRSFMHKEKIDVAMETINFRCEPYNTYFANKMYSHNCDSKFTWDGSQEPEWITPFELKEKVLDLVTMPDGRINCEHITLTGGNPGLVGKEMDQFIDIMHDEGFKFSMETQGVNWQDWYNKVDQIVMSPKPPSSKMKTNFKALDKIIAQLINGNANWSLKVVIFNDEDFEYARKVFNRYRAVNTKNPFNVSVGNEDALEQGDISQRLLRKLDWLWEKCLQDPDFNDVRPLPQLHTLVWANKRGV